MQSVFLPSAVALSLTFDSVVRGEVGAAKQGVPHRFGGAAPPVAEAYFFAPEGYAYWRVLVVLGAAPDLLFAKPKYITDGDYTNCPEHSA